MNNTLSKYHRMRCVCVCVYMNGCVKVISGNTITNSINHLTQCWSYLPWIFSYFYWLFSTTKRVIWSKHLREGNNWNILSTYFTYFCRFYDYISLYICLLSIHFCLYLHFWSLFHSASQNMNTLCSFRVMDIKMV